MAFKPNIAPISAETSSASTIVLFPICLTYGITGIDPNNVSTAAPSFERDLHLTSMRVGLVYSAFAYPCLNFQIIGDWARDRLGGRIALTVRGVIWASGTLLTITLSSLAALLFLRVMPGFGAGAMFPMSTRAISDWTSKEKRALVPGITNASAWLGNNFTPLVAWLIVAVAWRGSFIFRGFIRIARVIAWALYFRDDPNDHPEITSRELERVPSDAARKQREKESGPRLVLARRMIPAGVYFCYVWTLWLYLAWTPSFLLHSYRLNLKRSEAWDCC
jgi:MFS family permease